MRAAELHYRLSFGARKVRPGVLAMFFVLFCAGGLGSENMTLTVSYPATLGIYQKFLTTGNTRLATEAAGHVGVGIPYGTAMTYKWNLSNKVLPTDPFPRTEADAFYVGSGDLTYIGSSGIGGTNATGIFTSNGAGASVERVTFVGSIDQVGIGGVYNPALVNNAARIFVKGVVKLRGAGCIGPFPGCAATYYPTVVPGFKSALHNGGANVMCCPCGPGGCP